MTDAAAFLNSELMRLKGNPSIIGGIALQRILGSGGMGIVFLGAHLRLRIPVAVKFLYDQTQNKENIARFATEAALSARINSQNVVRVYDVNKDSPFHYIVQEYVEGETAEDKLRDSLVKKKPLAEHDVLNIAADAARGLAAIHAIRHLHLDIKPANLMVSSADLTTKIVDFGLAQPYDPNDIPGSVPEPGKMPVDGGTPGYSSPEQLRFFTVGPSSDIYSLGVTLFELLAGQRGFLFDSWEEACALQNQHELPSLLTIRPDISAATAALVEKCVKINPAERFQSGMELIGAISAADQSSVSKRLPQSAPPYTLPLSRRPMSLTEQESAHCSLAPLVFCVDDNLSVLELMYDILSEGSCRVEVFSDGTEVLKRMQTTVPDMVFVDMDMPTMSGLLVCVAMRAASNLKHVPVVFLTGNSSMQSLKAALREGATDYLVKPVKPAEVMARVLCLTRINRAQQELMRLESEFQSFQSRLSSMTGRKMP